MLLARCYRPAERDAGRGVAGQAGADEDAADGTGVAEGRSWIRRNSFLVDSKFLLKDKILPAVRKAVGSVFVYNLPTKTMIRLYNLI